MEPIRRLLALFAHTATLNTHPHTLFSHTLFFLSNEGPFSTYIGSEEAAEGEGVERKEQ